MGPIRHLLWSLPLLFLVPWFGPQVLIAIAASVLIDVDHIILLIRERDFSLGKMRYLSLHLHDLYMERRERPFPGVFYLFHTVECNAALLLLSLWYPPLAWVVVGFAYHILTDLVHHWRKGMPLHNWLFFYRTVWRE